MRCQLKSCGKCGGDLVMDSDEWRCWQCGTYYYPKAEAPAPPPDPEPLAEEAVAGSPGHLGSRWTMDYLDTLRWLSNG